MKEKITLRKAILAGVATIGLILFFVSFGATGSLKGIVEDVPVSVIASHIVWGCDTMVVIGEGFVTVPEALRTASVPGIIGAILFILVSGGLIATVFLVKDEKVKKIITFICGGLFLVAAILMFFVGEAVWEQFAKAFGTDAATAKAAYPGLKASSAYGIVAGIFGILMSGGTIASNFIPDKKLVK